MTSFDVVTSNHLATWRRPGLLRAVLLLDATVFAALHVMRLRWRAVGVPADRLGGRR